MRGDRLSALVRVCHKHKHVDLGVGLHSTKIEIWSLTGVDGLDVLYLEGRNYSISR